METGDVVVDQFGCRCIVANDDKARWHLDAGLFHQFERLLIMPVQGLQRRLQFHRNTERVKETGPGETLLRHLLSDMLPEIAELGHLFAGDVVGDRNARQFYDAALDGVHERELVHGPRKQRTFRVT